MKVAWKCREFVDDNEFGHCNRLSTSFGGQGIQQCKYAHQCTVIYTHDCLGSDPDRISSRHSHCTCYKQSRSSHFVFEWIFRFTHFYGQHIWSCQSRTSQCLIGTMLDYSCFVPRGISCRHGVLLEMGGCRKQSKMERIDMGSLAPSFVGYYRLHLYVILAMIHATSILSKLSHILCLRSIPICLIFVLEHFIANNYRRLHEQRINKSSTIYFSDHLFYNQIPILVPLQALLTCVGNTTAAYAALRIAISNGWKPPSAVDPLLEKLGMGEDSVTNEQSQQQKEESESLIGFEDLGNALAGDNDYSFLFKLFAGCAVASYIIKYGETFLDFPYEANVYLGFAVIGVPSALNAFKWYKRSQDPSFEGWF